MGIAVPIPEHSGTPVQVCRGAGGHRILLSLASRMKTRSVIQTKRSHTTCFIHNWLWQACRMKLYCRWANRSHESHCRHLSRKHLGWFRCKIGLERQQVAGYKLKLLDKSQPAWLNLRARTSFPSQQPAEILTDTRQILHCCMSSIMGEHRENPDPHAWPTNLATAYHNVSLDQ